MWVKREPKTFTVAGRDVSGGQGSVRSSLGKLSPISSRRLARSHKRSQHAFGATGMPQPICVVAVVVVRGDANALLRGIRSRVMSHVSPYAPRLCILDYYRGAHKHLRACLLFRGTTLYFAPSLSRVHTSQHAVSHYSSAHPTTTLQAILIATCPGYPGFLVPVI